MDVLGRHPQHLGQRDEEMEHIHDLDPRVLLVEFMVLGPPLPGHTVGQLRGYTEYRVAAARRRGLPRGVSPVHGNARSPGGGFSDAHLILERGL